MTGISLRSAWRVLVGLIVLALGPVDPLHSAEGQTTGNVRRVGIIHLSGHHQVMVDGLRQGLRELGLEVGKQIVLDVREISNDSKAAEEAARRLEHGKVDLIYTITTPVTIAAKRATEQTPIVFYVGADPVGLGLVESLAKPGGRLTGIHGLSRDLTAKRLEVLKDIIPKLGHVVTFYDPDNAVATENARRGREAARRLGVEFVERHVRSIEQVRLGLQGLKSGAGHAYFHTPDPLVTSQALLIVDAARGKRLPTMFHEEGVVARGALASYGHSFHEIGRLSAKHVQRIFTGIPPKVENYYKVGLALNLRTAREIGLAIPSTVRARADKLID